MVAERKAFNAYIDESGDEGWTRLGWRSRGVEAASTEWIVLGAVIVPAEVDAQRTAIVSELRQVIGKTTSKKPLHWRNLRNDHSKKRRAMDLLAQQRFKFCAAALWKPPLEERARGLREKKGYLYNYASRFLVERLTWLAEDHDRTVNLLFESRATTSYSALQGYLRTLQADTATTIKTDRIGEVRPVSPTWKGAQLADFYVSAAAEALEPDLDGYTEPDYFMRVRHQLYRHEKRSVLSYGFKVFPNEAVDFQQRPWLRDL